MAPPSEFRKIRDWLALLCAANDYVANEVGNEAANHAANDGANDAANDTDNDAAAATHFHLVGSQGKFDRGLCIRICTDI